MQLVPGIYKQLPSVVHDLRNQAAVAVLGHQPSPPCHQFQLASLDALVEFAHSAAVLLELNYTSTDAQQFGTQVPLTIASYHAWLSSHDSVHTVQSHTHKMLKVEQQQYLDQVVLNFLRLHFEG
ncbi:Uncharacterised protein [Acinetobacter baumannii]|nr:Uncharacterised protein [Acinetobacter baumannii]